jgi:hypothetical protein
MRKGKKHNTLMNLFGVLIFNTFRTIIKLHIKEMEKPTLVIA